MKHLINLIKEIELEYRSYGEIKSKELWRQLTELNSWDYRIIQDAIVRIDKYIKGKNLNFVYQLYDIEDPIINKNKKFDLLIACLKRDKNDTVLTDVRNRLVIPTELSFDILEIWGIPVTKARNLAVQKACEFGCKYLLFIDDDIVAPNNTVLKLYDIMKKSNSPAIAANYFRKIEPLISAAGKLYDYDMNFPDIKETDLLPMGCTLIDIDNISKRVPFPLFWEFGTFTDEFWSMGEDAFFTRNLIHYIKERPLIDFSIKVLHYDKKWKRCYGEKDLEVTYASNNIPDLLHFERLRVPDKFPIILIGIPTRGKDDPIACNLDELKVLRGYQCKTFRTYGDKVDVARTKIAEEALKTNSEFLLFIDDDIIPKDDSLCKMLDIMEKDLTIGAISGNYTLKGIPNNSIHLQLDKNGMVKELDRISGLDNIVECSWLVGLGYCLVRTEVFLQISKPWFLCHSKNIQERYVNEDAHFAELLLENGYKILIDQNMKCLHLDYEERKIYSFEDRLDFTGYCYFPWIKEFQYFK